MFSRPFKIGAFTLGGGYAMLFYHQNEVVERAMDSQGSSSTLVAVAQSCPGVFAASISIFVGYKMRKTSGALCTCLGEPSRPLFPHHPLHSPFFFHQFLDDFLDSRHVPRHTSCSSGPYRRSDVPAGRDARITLINCWIPVVTTPALSGSGSKPGIYHHRSRIGRLPLGEVHQTDRVRISPLNQRTMTEEK